MIVNSGRDIESRVSEAEEVHNQRLMGSKSIYTRGFANNFAGMHDPRPFLLLKGLPT